MADYISSREGEYVDFSDLNGLTISSVHGLEVGSDDVTITTADGTVFRMLHVQDCCECVSINDICGDVGDLIGAIVVDARRDSSSGRKEDEWYDESFTWTFYNIQTSKGHVQIRWFGSSNGDYSESVDFYRMKKESRVS